MAYEESEVFVKIKNGVKAPSGFHYMPNGKLMSDADHVAMFGYLEQTIKSVNIDTTDILNEGEQRVVTIKGDDDAVFSLEILKSDGKYYDFKTQTFVTGVRKLNKKRVGGSYSVNVKFPSANSVSYEINVIAETIWNIKTKHVDFVDFRNADDSVNINKTAGSNSNVLTKKIYQDPLKTLTFSCVAPSLNSTSTGTVNGATSSSNRIVLDEQIANLPSLYKIGDKITGTGIAASVHAIVTKINPDNDNVNEIEISVADSATDGDTLTFTPPFNGMTPSFTSGTGGDSILFSTSSSFSTTFTITLTPLTGRTFNVIRAPNTGDLCTIKTVTFGSAGLALEDEDTDSAAKFFRFPVDNISGLAEGMSLDPSRSGTGANTTTPAVISRYETTTTTTKIVESDFEDEIETTNLVNVSVPGVDFFNNPVTAVDRNGRTTAQAGNITFDVQQLDALKSDASVKIYAHGNKAIKQMTGIDANVTNVTITSAQVSTTTSGAVDNSTTIGLAEVGNVSAGMTVRGVGINASVVNPTVVSKSTTSGAGNIVVSSAQTLESGQTLFFDGATNEVTIKGTVELKQMGLSDEKLYFDVERFISAS